MGDLTPDAAARLRLVRAKIAALEDGIRVCEACGRRFAVPRGRGWPSRRYCDPCRDDGTAARVRRARQGVRYRRAAAILEGGPWTGG